jgi:GH24 family phage-related lysozyme (muramidase)
MDRALILTRLEQFEGRIPHMYRCTGGEVTIGIGHAIASPDDAVSLAWTVDGRAATPEEVRAGWAAVGAAQLGMPALKHATLSRCRMGNDAIDTLAAADVDRFAAQIAAALSKWSGYPTCVQSALFDMAFNLGLGGLLKFRNLLAACDAGDWATAAAECHRKGIAESRNDATAALFRQALS